MATIFANADAYQKFMGRWSVRLARPFLDFVRLGEGNKILDVGCGTGEFLRWLRAQRPEQLLVGLDHSELAIRHARKMEEEDMAAQVKVSSLSFLVSDAYDLHVPSNTIRAVYSGHLLEHLEDPVCALREQRRILRRGGTVIVHFPHEDAPYVEHRHILNFGKVMGWLEEAGFLVVGHSEVIPGRPTNDGFVWGTK